MKKLYLVLLLFPYAFSISSESIFQNIKDLINPSSRIRAFQKEHIWAQQTPPDHVVQHVDKLCSQITDEYLTEIKCLAGLKRAYTESGAQADFKKLHDHLAHIHEKKGQIDYLGKLESDRQKLEHWRTYIHCATKKAEIQRKKIKENSGILRSIKNFLTWSKDEPIIDPSRPDVSVKKINKECTAALKDAPAILKKIDTIDKYLNVLQEKFIVPYSKGVYYEEYKEQITQIRNTILKPSLNRMVKGFRIPQDSILYKLTNAFTHWFGNSPRGTFKQPQIDSPVPNLAADQRKIARAQEDLRKAEKGLDDEIQRIQYFMHRDLMYNARQDEENEQSEPDAEVQFERDEFSTGNAQHDQFYICGAQDGQSPNFQSEDNPHKQHAQDIERFNKHHLVAIRDLIGSQSIEDILADDNKVQEIRGKAPYPDKKREAEIQRKQAKLRPLIIAAHPDKFRAEVNAIEDEEDRNRRIKEINEHSQKLNEQNEALKRELKDVPKIDPSLLITLFQKSPAACKVYDQWHKCETMPSNRSASKSSREVNIVSEKEYHKLKKDAENPERVVIEKARALTPWQRKLQEARNAKRKEWLAKQSQEKNIQRSEQNNEGQERKLLVGPNQLQSGVCAGILYQHGR